MTPLPVLLEPRLRQSRHHLTPRHMRQLSHTATSITSSSIDGGMGSHLGLRRPDARSWMLEYRRDLRTLDVLHLAACRLLGAVMITCDRRLHEAAVELGDLVPSRQPWSLQEVSAG